MLSSWDGKSTRVDRVLRVRNLTVCVFTGEDAWGWQGIGYMRPIKCRVLPWLQGLELTRGSKGRKKKQTQPYRHMEKLESGKLCLLYTAEPTDGLFHTPGVYGLQLDQRDRLS